MATGGKGSDESVTKYCTSCVLEDKHIDAFGYCLMCIEYLCKNCFEVHCKPLLTRNHVLLKEDEMPITNISKTINHVDVLCKLHNKPIDYYCQKCEDVGCNDCMRGQHKTCVKVTFIPQYREGENDSNHVRVRSIFYGDPLQRTTKLATTIQRLKYVVKCNTEKAKQELKEWRDEVENELDKFEAEINEKMQSICLNDLKTLSTTAKRCQHFHEMFQGYNDCIENADGHELFVYNVLAKNAEVKFKENNEIQKLEDQMKIRKVSFQANMLDTFGNLVYVEGKSQKKTMKMAGYLQTKTSTEDHCRARECIVLRNGFLMLTDTMGKSVRICSTNITEPEGEDKAMVSSTISVIEFDEAPWGLVEFFDQEVAVTEPKSQMIRILHISFKQDNEDESISIKLFTSFGTNGECQSIAWLDEEFVVSFNKPAKVEVLSCDGTVLRTVNYTNGFEHPISVACDVEQKRIYIADFQRSTIVLADGEGNVKAEYDKFSNPMSLAFDNEGRVLVAVKWPFSLQIISSDFFDHEVLLDIDQVFYIQSIAYSKSEHCVYIIYEWSSRIQKWML